ncbi:MAG: GNAT family N-acetyltransferase [Chloroflexi bacterium]|nr:GNAT family N-acetyltransferase [Chloroflexota bacterium]
MIIRMIRESDAEQLLNLRRLVNGETQFMLREPDEMTTTVAEQQEQIKQTLAKENQAIFVAEHDNQLVGYLNARGGPFKRNRHCVYIVIGILKAFTRQGIGTQLFIELERWARQQGLTRLELTVMTHNAAGIALYKKRGFEIEGMMRHALIVDGQYVDEYFMAKLLD